MNLKARQAIDAQIQAVIELYRQLRARHPGQSREFIASLAEYKRLNAEAIRLQLARIGGRP